MQRKNLFYKNEELFTIFRGLTPHIFPLIFIVLTPFLSLHYQINSHFGKIEVISRGKDQYDIPHT